MKALIFSVYLFVAPINVLNYASENFGIISKIHLSTERKITADNYTDFNFLNYVDFVLNLFDNIQRWFIWWSSLVLW